MKPTIKLMKPKRDDDPHILLNSRHRGDIDTEKRQVAFTINIAPDNMETDDQMDQSLATLELSSHILYLQEVLTIMTQLGEELVVEADFYWGEQDLLLRLIISFDHPLLKSINLDEVKI